MLACIAPLTADWLTASCVCVYVHTYMHSRTLTYNILPSKKAKHAYCHSYIHTCIPVHLTLRLALQKKTHAYIYT